MINLFRDLLGKEYSMYAQMGNFIREMENTRRSLKEVVGKKHNTVSKKKKYFNVLISSLDLAE